MGVPTSGPDELHSAGADVNDATIVRDQSHASGPRRKKGNDGAQLEFVQ